MGTFWRGALRLFIAVAVMATALVGVSTISNVE